MSVDHLDETLHLIADVAASFATRDAARVRAVRDGGGDVDRVMWRRMAENGWLSILVPEDRGGAGLGADALALVARRLGYAGFPEPFVAAGVLAPVVLAAAQDAEARDRLAAVIAGDVLAGVGWQADVTARDDGGDTHRLSGRSRFLGVGGADGYVVAGRGLDGVALFWVPAHVAGLTVVDERGADGTLSASLYLDDVVASRILPAPTATEVLDAGLDVARLAVSAELVGVMDAMLEMTLEYLGQRQQFGRPIGTFQALQHRAVDAWIQRELSSAALDAAVRVHDDPASGTRARACASSGVKARAALAAPAIGKTAVQLHGAIGYTDEYDVGLYVNRALTLAPWLGNASEHTRRHADIADDMEVAR